MSTNENIGARIKNIRISLGLTMEEFGLKFNPPANKSLVSKWESGKSLPNNERLKRISELGNIPINYLLKGSMTINDSKKISQKLKSILYDEHLSGINLDFKVKENDNKTAMLEKFNQNYSPILSKSVDMLIALQSLSFPSNDSLPLLNISVVIEKYLNLLLTEPSEYTKEDKFFMEYINNL